jgi:uncharacterized protein YfiM (DUF2279 family)
VIRFARIFFLLTAILVSFNTSAQSFFEKSDTLNLQRRNIVVGSTVGIGSLTIVGLNELWYKDYPRSSFHFINDNSNWLQMDKVGHATTAYYMGSLGMKSFRWSGMSEKNAIWYGGSVGLIFLTTVEVLDGFSEEWGASWGDLIANTSGTALLIGQELLWHEQRMELKFSYHPTSYAEQNPGSLGSTPLESILKDYNGQTYWLSVNPWSFAKESRFPKWLSVSVGYGAEGMITAIPPEGGDNRYRKFLLSLDLKLSNIDTGSKFWNSVFDVINVIKIPSPTLEYNTKGEFIFHPIYF